MRRPCICKNLPAPQTGGAGHAGWDGLVREHLLPAARLPRAAALVSPLSPSSDVELRAWLRRMAASRYVARFVRVAANAPQCRWSGWECALTQDEVAAGVRRVRVLCTSRADLAFAVSELIPLAAACSCMLRAASPSTWPAGGVDVVYLASPAKRVLPAPGVPVAAEHVNGGLTNLAPLNSGGPLQVLVYRREDAAKVLVHELIHASGIEGRLRTGAAVHDASTWLCARHAHLGARPAPGTPLGLGDAFVDALACWVHARWWAARRGDPAGQGAMARVASHIQAVAALVQEHATSLPPGNTAEHTHAFAYYVAKAAAWRRLGEFLDLAWPPPPGAGGPGARCPWAFARFLDQELLAWTHSGAPRARSLRMTPLQ